jgi:protein involved in polysaccharide export with SLBB domain
MQGAGAAVQEAPHSSAGQANRTEQAYTVKVGDTITVTVWEREWLSGTVVVDTNGQIHLPRPIGTVKVLGLNLDQITELLTERLKEQIIEPIVSVSISPALGFAVHITGEVQAPNSLNVMDGTSLQEAITRAGGFTDLADKKHIKIIRQDKEQKDVVSELIIDFTQFEENAAPNSNPPLKNEDVVVVPRLPKSERMPAVMVIGAVNSPGAIPIEEPLPLIKVLARAGGTSIKADLKNLSILSLESDEYSQKQLDLERFLTGADLSANPTVSSGEIIFVPELPSKEELSFTVNVIGQAVRQGAYPIYKEGRLFDVIYAAGGFTDEAAIDKVTIIRPRLRRDVPPANPEPQKIEVNAKNYLTTGDPKYNPLLEEGDSVFIPIQEVTKRIPGIQTAFFESMRLTIIGEVKIPDTYQVSKESAVLDVLKLAGGPTRDADLERVMIIREKEQRMQIDLEKVLQEGEFQLLPPLQANDTIFVPKIREERNIWRTIVRAALDVATVVTAYLLIENRIGK